MALYKGFKSQEEIDAQYDVLTVDNDSDRLLASHFALSAETRSTYRAHLQIPYGPTRAEYLDIFTADQPNAPVLVFFHGGVVVPAHQWSRPRPMCPRPSQARDHHYHRQLRTGAPRFGQRNSAPSAVGDRLGLSEHRDLRRRPGRTSGRRALCWGSPGRHARAH